MGARSPLSPSVRAGDRNIIGSTELSAAAAERGPHTLAEKYVAPLSYLAAHSLILALCIGMRIYCISSRRRNRNV